MLPRPFHGSGGLHSNSEAGNHGRSRLHTKVIDQNRKKRVVDWTSDETGKGSEGSSKADLITEMLYCPASGGGYKTLGADKKTAPKFGAVFRRSDPHHPAMSAPFMVLMREYYRYLCRCGVATGFLNATVAFYEW